VYNAVVCRTAYPYNRVLALFGKAKHLNQRQMMEYAIPAIDNLWLVMELGAPTAVLAAAAKDFGINVGEWTWAHKPYTNYHYAAAIYNWCCVVRTESRRAGPMRDYLYAQLSAR
jgi:hypothetical protein